MKKWIPLFVFVFMGLGAKAQKYQPNWISLGISDISTVSRVIDSCFVVMEINHPHTVKTYVDSVVGDYRVLDRSIWLGFLDSTFAFQFVTHTWVTGKYVGLKHMQIVIMASSRSTTYPFRVLEMTDGGYASGKDNKTCLVAPVAYEAVLTGEGPSDYIPGTEEYDPRLLVEHFNYYTKLLQKVAFRK